MQYIRLNGVAYKRIDDAETLARIENATAVPISDEANEKVDNATPDKKTDDAVVAEKEAEVKTDSEQKTDSEGEPKVDASVVVTEPASTIETPKIVDGEQVQKQAVDSSELETLGKKQNIDSLFNLSKNLSKKMTQTIKTYAESNTLNSRAGVKFVPFDKGGNNFDFTIYVKIVFSSKVKELEKSAEIASKSASNVGKGIKMLGFKLKSVSIKEQDENSVTFIANASYHYEDKIEGVMAKDKFSNNKWR